MLSILIFWGNWTIAVEITCSKREYGKRWTNTFSKTVNPSSYMTLLEEYFRKIRGIATLPETNIAPEKMAPQTEINVPTINFQGLFLTVSGRVLYSQEHVVMRILAKRNPKACWKLLTHWNLSCFSSCEIQATRYRHLTRIFVWCPRDGWGVKMVVMVWFWREANHLYNHVSNEKKPSCLEYIGDYAMQLYGDYNKAL